MLVDKIHVWVFQIKTRLIDSLNENSDNKNVSYLIFDINQKITTTESYFPHFSPETFLAELGGSLGLWLGVGAVQILSGVYKILLWTQTNKR